MDVHTLIHQSIILKYICCTELFIILIIVTHAFHINLFMRSNENIIILNINYKINS